MGSSENGGKSYPRGKNLLISSIRKIPLNRFKSFRYQQLHFFPIKQQFSSNHPMQPLFVAAVIFVVSCFKFQTLCTQCHANLTNQCLLNVAFSMTKALNNWSSPKQNFHSLHLCIPILPPMLFRKPCFYYRLFSTFSHSLFYFKLDKISTDSSPIRNLWLCELIKYNRFQISGNKSYET